MKGREGRGVETGKGRGEGGVESEGREGGEERACTILGNLMLLSIPPSSQP